MEILHDIGHKILLVLPFYPVPMFFHVFPAVEAVDFKVSQYRIYYASNWEGEWHAASPATQQRLAEDGKVYTVAEFVQHLGGF